MIKARHVVAQATRNKTRERLLAGVASRGPPNAVVAPLSKLVTTSTTGHVSPGETGGGGGSSFPASSRDDVQVIEDTQETTVIPSSDPP